MFFTSLTGILSGRIRTDNPFNFVSDLFGIDSPEDVMRANCENLGMVYKGGPCA